MIASFGNFNKLPLGGGQTAARRLLKTMQGLGYRVIAIHRHPPTSHNNVVRGFQFVFWMLIDPLIVAFRLLFKPRDNSLVMYMGYMGVVLIPLEWIFARLSHFLGFKNLFYLAGGGTEIVYNRLNSVLKFFERSIIRSYYLILTEGIENISFIRRFSNVNTAYLPNYTEKGFDPSFYPEKPLDRWNFIYFGRICKEKNVLLIIAIFNRLCELNSNSNLTIVGGGPEDYNHIIEASIAASPFYHKITRIGRSSHEELRCLLPNYHFYLFPSIEPREGHSNALNEAMSFGLVPVVSDNNFLPSIVANSRLVAHEQTVQAYVDIVLDIIENGDFDKLSHEMYNRVKLNYTQSVIESRLKDIFDSI